jgi:hypothetical protein
MIKDNFIRGDRPLGAAWLNEVARAANNTSDLKKPVHGHVAHSNNGLTGQAVVRANNLFV